MSDNPRVNVIADVLQKDLVEITGRIPEEQRDSIREVLEADAERILEALDKYDDALVASMPRAFPDSVEVRLEVTLPDSLQPDRTKQRNGARILIDPKNTGPGLADNITRTVEALIDVAGRIVELGGKP